VNNHIIVGDGRRCLCGSYNGKRVFCQNIIFTLNQLEAYAHAKDNPALYVRKGERNPVQPPSNEEVLLLVEAIKPLIQDCQ
jgi:hypothetical protein